MHLLAHLFRSLAKLLFCLLLAVGLRPVFAQETGYRFSPVNQWDLQKTAAYWNPILQYISEKSCVKLQLKLGRTSADTTAYVLAQEVDFVFSNHLFSPERDALGWKVFGRRAAPPLHAQIVVPVDSPISALEQLRGQEVAFAGPEAFIGYKLPYSYLMSKGIDIKVVFGGNQNAAFAQMFAGRAKAVGSNSMLVEAYEAREGKKFRVLWNSDGYYDLALMASAKVPPAAVRLVASAFAGMHQDSKGREVLKRANAEVGLAADQHFVQSDGSEYRNYRAFYQSAPSSLR